jgi:cell division protein FtsL
MRLLNATAFLFAVTSALMLYSLNYEIRRLEADVMQKERAAEKAKSDIAVLKAERSHLARPERIDALARQQGLQPPRPDQFPGLGAVSSLAESGSENQTRAPNR